MRMFFCLQAAQLSYTSLGVLSAPMSSSPIVAWSALIKTLQKLVDGPTLHDNSTPALRAAEKHFASVATLRRVTHTTWKKLILDEKVIRHASGASLNHQHAIRALHAPRPAAAKQPQPPSATGAGDQHQQHANTAHMQKYDSIRFLSAPVRQ
jgi:hypothetical protein